MSEMNISQKVLEEIKNKKIEPTARWRFLLHDYFLWATLAASIIIGSFAFSIIIFMIRNNDWEIYEKSGGLFDFVMSTLPYFWLAILAGIIFLAEYNLRHTKRGYRFEMVGIIISSVALSVIFGSALYKSGFGQKLEMLAAKKMPFYQMLTDHRERIWNQPDRGLLAGEVIMIDQNGQFSLVDLVEKKWRVIGEDIEFRRVEPLVIGRWVRIVGEKIDEDIFRAVQIRPWLGQFRPCEHQCPFMNQFPGEIK
jgi:hypothetical protein